MALSELTDPTAVEKALDEFDRLGRETFLEKYGFRPSRSYFIERDGKLYDSKAIIGAAFGNQYPGQGPLGPREFSGGEATVRRRLEDLGFAVRAQEATAKPLSRISSTKSLSCSQVGLAKTRRRWSSGDASFGKADLERWNACSPVSPPSVLTRW